MNRSECFRKTIDPMTGNSVYSVPEPYNRDKNDTCDYDPPLVSLSTTGCKIFANISKGSYDLTGATIYINGVEKGAVALGGGSIYTLTGDETSARLDVTDSAGYVASTEVKLQAAGCKKPEADPTTPVDDNSTNE